MLSPAPLIVGLWIAWALSWFAAAWWSNTTQKSAGMRREVGYRLVMVVGTVLFSVPAHGYQGALRLWHINLPGAWLCVALMIIGLAFCWWGRIRLGRLWSGQITRKEGHRVVDTGPYAVVRHPIYTGILLAVAATIAAKGTILGLGGGVLIAIGLWMKARLEEAWLAQELGAEEYRAYQRRVPMLIPFGPRAR